MLSENHSSGHGMRIGAEYVRSLAASRHSCRPHPWSRIAHRSGTGVRVGLEPNHKTDALIHRAAGGSPSEEF